MSKRKRGQPRPFLGHQMTRRDQGIISSVIGMTTLPLGVSKRKIKSEDQIFDVLERVFGFQRNRSQSFIGEMRRAHRTLKALTPEDRQACFAQAGVKKVRQAGPKCKMAARYGAKARDDFYASWEWRTLRMKILKEFGRRCMCCGATPDMTDSGGYPVRICVDHIEPLAKRWDLRLERDNLQVLCDECNQGKGAWDQSDYRPDEFPEEPELSPIEQQLGERLRIIDGGLAA